MPVGGLLEFVGDIQNFCFLHVVTNQLHADGQACGCAATGLGQAACVHTAAKPMSRADFFIIFDPSDEIGFGTNSSIPP